MSDTSGGKVKKFLLAIIISLLLFSHVSAASVSGMTRFSYVIYDSNATGKNEIFFTSNGEDKLSSTGDHFDLNPDKKIQYRLKVDSTRPGFGNKGYDGFNLKLTFNPLKSESGFVAPYKVWVELDGKVVTSEIEFITDSSEMNGKDCFIQISPDDYGSIGKFEAIYDIAYEFTDALPEVYTSMVTATMEAL